MSNPNNKPGQQNQKPQQQSHGQDDANQRQQQQDGGGHNPAQDRGGPSRDRKSDTKRPGAGKK